MSFIWPYMLVFLLLVPLLVLLYRRQLRRREQVLARYGGFGLTLSAAQPSSRRRHVPMILFLVGITILLVGMARPQSPINLPRIEGTVVLVFDVSGSMAATDLEPSRMEVAKAVARDFVERQPSGVRIGVVAFSDSGLNIQPPTNEQELVLTAINRLAPQRGTSLGFGMLSALEELVGDDEPEEPLYTNREPSATPAPVPPGSRRSELIVLISDGENTADPDPLEVAQAAANLGIRVYTIGIGSVEGVPLEVEGFTVHTALDEEMLQQIAAISAAEYFRAASPEQLREIYDAIELQLVVRPEEIELTALFAALGVLVLLIGAFFSMQWFGRIP
jgi:Ca-activated chloride channel family protein